MHRDAVWRLKGLRRGRNVQLCFYNMPNIQPAFTTPARCFIWVISHPSKNPYKKRWFTEEEAEAQCRVVDLFHSALRGWCEFLTQVCPTPLPQLYAHQLNPDLFSTPRWEAFLDLPEIINCSLFYNCLTVWIIEYLISAFMQFSFLQVVNVWRTGTMFYWPLWESSIRGKW